MGFSGLGWPSGPVRTSFGFHRTTGRYGMDCCWHIRVSGSYRSPCDIGHPWSPRQRRISCCHKRPSRCEIPGFSNKKITLTTGICLIWWRKQLGWQVTVGLEGWTDHKLGLLVTPMELNMLPISLPHSTQYNLDLPVHLSQNVEAMWKENCTKKHFPMTGKVKKIIVSHKNSNDQTQTHSAGHLLMPAQSTASISIATDFFVLQSKQNGKTHRWLSLVWSNQLHKLQASQSRVVFSSHSKWSGKVSRPL